MKSIERLVFVVLLRVPPWFMIHINKKLQGLTHHTTMVLYYFKGAWSNMKIQTVITLLWNGFVVNIANWWVVYFFCNASYLHVRMFTKESINGINVYEVASLLDKAKSNNVACIGNDICRHEVDVRIKWKHTIV